MGGTYGSDIRDEAMIMETLTLLGRKAEAAKLTQSLAIKLGKDDWYSTQTTAYSLLAIAKFCGANSASSNLQYSYTIDGKQGKVNSNQFLSSTALTFNGATVWPSAIPAAGYYLYA